MAKLEAIIKALEVFESLSLDYQKPRIQNLKFRDSHDYNLLDYELNNDFNFDFKKDTRKKKDNIEETHEKNLVVDDNLGFSTPKLYHFSFKYGFAPQLAEYSTLKKSKIEFLISFTPPQPYYSIFKYVLSLKQLNILLQRHYKLKFLTLLILRPSGYTPNTPILKLSTLIVLNAFTQLSTSKTWKRFIYL